MDEIREYRQPVVDAHVHLDKYEEKEKRMILKEMDSDKVRKLISVSEHFASCERNLALSREDKRVRPAFGWHPEQLLPAGEEIADICAFCYTHVEQMVAVGEVGLPYYLRKKQPEISLDPYIDILAFFIEQAVRLHKPVVLHAIYSDAPVVCELLENYSVRQAHFHWLKGDRKTIEQMKQNGYFVSVTPDVLYEQEVQHLVKMYPLTQMMVETDGPWPFKGPFAGKLTRPAMVHRVIHQIANLKNLHVSEVYGVILENTEKFYRL